MKIKQVEELVGITSKNILDFMKVRDYLHLKELIMVTENTIRII